MFFSLSSWALALILFAVVVGTTVLGLVAGHHLRRRGDALREPFGVAPDGDARHRRAAPGLRPVARHRTVRDAPGRRRRRCQRDRHDLPPGPDAGRARPHAVARSAADSTPTRRSRSRTRCPSSAGMRRTIAAQYVLQRRLWGLAGQALDDAPVASAPRLYVETLNEMIDQQTVRISALNNRVPGSVLLLEVVGRSRRARAARPLPLPPRAAGRSRCWSPPRS